MTYDAVIVGTGTGRNVASDAVHNFLSRDGIAPGDLHKIALEQLGAYPTVEIRAGEAESVTAVDGEFKLDLAGGDHVGARRLLLATGVADELPSIPGLAERWGRGVVHCPYCHGWERRDLPLAVFALGEHGVQLAIHLRRFSRDVVLCRDKDFDLTQDHHALLAARDVPSSSSHWPGSRVMVPR